MILTVDVGNTQTATGLFEGENLRESWHLTTNAESTSDEIHLLLDGQFRLHGLDLGACERFVIASVVPSLTGCWAQVARRVTGSEPIVLGPDIETGLALRYDNPDEIGADRVADALGAIALVGAPVVVVDLGTATNIEVVNDQGEFLGGIIAPGLGTGARDLAAHAARLPLVGLSEPDHVIGTNTVDAMQSGLVYGEASRIDGLVRRIFGELGYTAPVIATGGYANVMARLCETVTHHEENLTLEGLRLVYERNK